MQEVETVLNYINTNPPAFFNMITIRQSMETIVNGARCKFSIDKIRGGIVVFLPKCVVHFMWDKNAEKWNFSSFN